MNIVFLSHEYPLWASGGIGTFLQTLCRELTAHGHQATIVGPGVDSEEVVMEDQGVNLIRFKKNTGFLPDFIHNAIEINKCLKRLHKEQPIDIIEASELGLAIVYSSHPAKKVIRLHGGHHFFAEAEKRGINWRKGLLEKFSFRKADGFIAVSHYVKSHTAKYLSYRDKPVKVINYPIDTDLEIPDVGKKADRVLFAGTICEKKGVRELIQAFHLVRNRYPQMHLDLYGRDWLYPDGRSYIEELRKDFPKQYFEQVYFNGSIPRDELNKKYAAAAICVFPSHMETQGLVSLEAMLLERPVVFSKYGPGPETIEHGITGLLADVYDPVDIAQQILRYLEHPDQAKSHGGQARKVVLEKYNKHHILKQNLDFYSRLLA